MPIAGRIDITTILEDLALRLIRHPDPRPLATDDALTLRIAAMEIERLRGLVRDHETTIRYLQSAEDAP